jgi:DNA-binding NarL/FixJ family response regulator
MRFLVVDDADHVRASLRAVLELETGWRVVGETADPAAAAHLARHLHPDVILLDAHLPGVDAVDLGRHLKTLAAVVLLTVHDNPQLYAAARASGIDLCIAKGEGVSGLMDSLRAAFGRPVLVARP